MGNKEENKLTDLINASAVSTSLGCCFDRCGGFGRPGRPGHRDFFFLMFLITQLMVNKVLLIVLPAIQYFPRVTKQTKKKSENTP